MLQGWYDHDGGESSPYIAGDLYLPKLDAKGSIEFLIDTGSDHTVIMPKDALLLGIDYASLSPSDDFCYGMGGKTKEFEADARVIFTVPGEVIFQWNIRAHFIEATPDHLMLPSVLGRDILNCWCLTLDPLGKRLEAEVRRFGSVTWLDPEKEAAYESRKNQSSLKLRS